MANNVGKAAELLKILTRVKKLEQEVRRNKHIVTGKQIGRAHV